MAALAATGALIVGGSAVAMVGSGNADPLDLSDVPVIGTTYVEPDLAPFTTLDTRAPGTAEVSDAFGAPTGGGEAALRLQTPGDEGKAKASIIKRFAATSPDSQLAAWTTSAYSAYQDSADFPDQFPSLQLEVDFNGPAEGGFSTLTYEPVYNTTPAERTPGEWHRYQAGTGRWCSTREIPDVIPGDQTRCDNGGDKPLSAYLMSEGIVVTGVIINQGSGNPDLDAAVDLVATPTTTYDFELTAPEVIPGGGECEEPTLPDVPELPEVPEGEHGGGHEDGGHEDGGHEDGGQDNGGHEQPDAGHEDDGGHEQPDNGGHEEPQPDPEPQPEPEDPCK
ncbi:hypothetical protein [Actinomycetospora sp. CA-053990]|uniref:hypothetical protein n=1 Tax=Actinomycetospora sp. CA-053990 TaxID=3239891 RepID=UPI003D91B8FE